MKTLKCREEIHTLLKISASKEKKEIQQLLEEILIKALVDDEK